MDPAAALIVALLALGAAGIVYLAASELASRRRR